MENNKCGTQNDSQHEVQKCWDIR